MSGFDDHFLHTLAFANGEGLKLLIYFEKLFQVVEHDSATADCKREKRARAKEKCNIGSSNAALAPANCSLHPTNVTIYTKFHTFPGFGQNDKTFRSGLQFPEHLAEGFDSETFQVFFLFLVEHQRCKARNTLV